MIDFIFKLGINITTPIFQFIHTYLISDIYWAIFTTCFIVAYLIELLHEQITDYPVSAFKAALFFSFLVASTATGLKNVDYEFGGMLFALLASFMISIFFVKDFIMSFWKD